MTERHLLVKIILALGLTKTEQCQEDSLLEGTKVTSGSFIKLLPQVLMNNSVSVDFYLKSSDGSSKDLLCFLK